MHQVSLKLQELIYNWLHVWAHGGWLLRTSDYSLNLYECPLAAVTLGNVTAPTAQTPSNVITTQTDIHHPSWLPFPYVSADTREAITLPPQLSATRNSKTNLPEPNDPNRVGPPSVYLSPVDTQLIC